MNKYIQVITTVDKKETAEKIANYLLKKRLCACCQILGPVKSSYWWRAKIEKTREWLCIIKTRKDFYKKIEESVKKIHPYKIPEILAVSVIKGNLGYLKWLDNEIDRKNED